MGRTRIPKGGDARQGRTDDNTTSDGLLSGDGRTDGPLASERGQHGGPRRRSKGDHPGLEDWFIRLLSFARDLLPRRLVPLRSLCEERPGNNGRRPMRKLLWILLAGPVSRLLELLLLCRRDFPVHLHAFAHSGQKKNAEGSLWPARQLWRRVLLRARLLLGMRSVSRGQRIEAERPFPYQSTIRANDEQQHTSNSHNGSSSASGVHWHPILAQETTSFGRRQQRRRRQRRESGPS